jgi:hypothetical protein
MEQRARHQESRLEIEPFNLCSFNPMYHPKEPLADETRQEALILRVVPENQRAGLTIKRMD